MSRRRSRAGRASRSRSSSPRRPSISAPASTLGLKSKTTELSSAPMRTVSPSSAPIRASLTSTPSRFRRSARKPTASSLLKSVCRTHRSGLVPRTRQPVVGGDDLEVVAAVDRLRPEHDALGLGRGRDLAGRDDDLGHGEGQLAQARTGRGADLEDAQVATRSSSTTMSAMSWPSGTSTLLRATNRGRSSRPP